jgi:uncharacterized protein YdhG (YjbR/CyaY superfamily)
MAAQTIDHYIASYPKEVQAILQKIRKMIQKIAPEAKEKMNYGVPTFDLHGNLVHFGAYAKHIGFYSLPKEDKALVKAIEPYKTGKGSIQFSLDKPIPYDLIEWFVKQRIIENTTKFKEKSKRTCKQGHVFYKTSDCPTCPQCEALQKPKEGFATVLGAPARRALDNAGIKTLKKLSTYSEEQILALHGMGPSSIPKLKSVLSQEGLTFKSPSKKK